MRPIPAQAVKKKENQSEFHKWKVRGTAVPLESNPVHIDLGNKRLRRRGEGACWEDKRNSVTNQKK